MKKALINTSKATKYDNFNTPEMAVYPLLKHFANRIPIPSKCTIWECCDPGGSAIKSVLKNYGYEVISTDIQTGFDFLHDVPDFDFDAIITNPPYSKKDQFLEKCFHYNCVFNIPFALLLPLTALESIYRGTLFSLYGISVVVLNRRIDFTGKKQNWFNTSWFFNGTELGNRLYFEKLEE